MAKQNRLSPLRAAAMVAIGVLGASAIQAQTLSTYDTFSTTTIAPARWYAEEGRQYGGIRTEARRAIVDGQLRVEARGYSDNASNTGSSTARNSVIFANSSEITAIRSTVTMRSVTTGTCAGNTTTPTVARGRVFGFFFNAGTPIPGSNYNDVFAGVQLYRASNSTDGAGVLRASAFVGICTDDSCIASAVLASQELGTTTLNTATELQVTWDAANNRFTFQKDDDTAVNLAYTVADGHPASFPVKRLEVSNQIAHCTASRPSGFAAVDFDNVKIARAATEALRAQATPDRESAASFDRIVGRAN
ncbi:MAG TPA: hypothetical protein VGQ91_09375 [Ideonella sp.]|jgi:hypothetical protein|nr:hypothetical protein [Ideonella sp.]